MLFGFVSAATIAPVAKFTANITSGTAPLPVLFTDRSTNNPLGWAWYFGDETYTAPWTLRNVSSGWSARYYYSSVAMRDGSIVLMGGKTDVFKNDTWRSTDNGATWTRLTASASWTARSKHSSVAMRDGSIVLMGGEAHDYTFHKNDTWRSINNGKTWRLQNASSGWSARYRFSSLAMPDGSIVLMGGEAWLSPFLNDTWRSTDNGTTWKLMTASAGWTARRDHTSVVMPDGTIVLMGGYDISGNPGRNDVWRSKDNGATWTQANASAGWSARYSSDSVAMPDGSIVLMGGQAGNPTNDTWRSTDTGATWTLMNASAGWSARSLPSSVAMPDGSVVLMGGYDGHGPNNDTWRFVPTGSSLQNPSHTYTMPGIYKVALQVYNTIGYNSTIKRGYINVKNATINIGVFRNSTHLFYLDYNGNGVWNGSVVDRQYNFGLSGDLPISGDWNNDGKYEIGVFRNSTKLFYLDYNGNGVWNGSVVDRQYNFSSINGDLPVSGDWNNDRKSEIGVYRNSTKLFYLDYNGNGVWNGSVDDRQYNFSSINGDLPVSGDWNNDGISEIGVFRNSTHLFYLDYNGNGVWNGSVVDRQYNFGLSGDLPISGDWNNNGKSEIGVYRNSTKLFYLDYNGNGVWNGSVVDRQYNFSSISGDKPVSGKW
jgi:PKD repeat protein